MVGEKAGPASRIPVIGDSHYDWTDGHLSTTRLKEQAAACSFSASFTSVSSVMLALYPSHRLLATWYTVLVPIYGIYGV